MSKIVLSKVITLTILLNFTFLNSLKSDEHRTAEFIFKNQDTEVVKVYAMGIMDGIAHYAITAKDWSPSVSHLICFSNESNFSNDDYFNLIEAEYIKNRSTYKNFSFSQVVVLTLMKLHPC